jgi:hypothetical protein
LFLFSLTEKGQQSYTRSIGNMSDDWEELWDDFCYSFSLTERIDSLRLWILFMTLQNINKPSIWQAPELFIVEYFRRCLQVPWNFMLKVLEVMRCSSPKSSFIWCATTIALYME